MRISSRTRDRLDAAWRLGPRPVLLAGLHRAPPARWLAGAVLADAALPRGPFLAPAVRPAPALPMAAQERLLAAAAEVAPGDWHGPFAPDAPALGLDLFGPGDIRPVWERNRWAELPLLAQAARLQPAGGHLARAEALLADWVARNPPFRGPNWACGQEAALRALHLGLALALLGGPPGPAARALLALHGRRIAATARYAMAQDNNHAVSEAAGLWLCGCLAGRGDWARAGIARLERALLRLVSPDGAFAQLSTGYHRLLLDVLSVAAWLGLPLGLAARARAAAAMAWLRPLVAPGTGAMPRLGHQDGSCFADLALAGPDDARASLERAARSFAGGSAGWPVEPGCAWLGLPAAAPLPPAPVAWTGAGLRGWSAASDARGFLRTGPLRFRPGQADLLHLELWDGDLALLRDGGTGAYNPVDERLVGTAGHNTIAFDDADQMPRLSRFLYAQWPETGALPAGGWIRDHRGNRQAREVAVAGRRWRVTDRVAGPFRHLALRWRLAPAAWRLTADGAESPLARLVLVADAPLALTLEQGWESPAYGVVRPAPVLAARAVAPVGRIVTEVNLPATHGRHD